MRNKLIAGLAAGFIAAVGIAVPAQAASATTADVSVLHAVPGLVVDVYVTPAGAVLTVDEVKTLDSFAPGTLAGPLSLPVGSYDIRVFGEDADPTGTPAIQALGVALSANTDYTVAAHLSESGDPVLTAFVNDLSNIAAGQGRLTVRHIAAAPTVDILANGAPLAGFTGLSNPNEAKGLVPAGSYTAGVAAAGTTDALIESPLAIKEGVNTIVYAWGSLEDDSLTLFVQEFSGLHSAPGGVDAGSAGLAADPSPTAVAWTIAGVIALLAAAGVTVLRVRSARSDR